MERSQHNEKIVDQHTQQAEGYARLTRGMAGARPTRLQMIEPRPDDELLDVACGPGWLTLELAPHVARATGLDITPAMLDQARAVQSEKDIGNIDWIEGDGARLPFPDGAFSLVTCSSAFHHFEEPAAILAEMARVCRSGGRVVVSDVTPEAGKAAAYDLMEKMRDPSHNHAHPVDELSAMGERLGLGAPRVQSDLTPPMSYAAVLATSFPEEHSRDDLLAAMRADAESGADALGFSAALGNEAEVLVRYPMSILIWTRS